MTIRDDKRRFRQAAIAARNEGAGDAVKSGAALSARFFAALDDAMAIPPGCVVSAFWPVQGEIDLTGLMAGLSGRGFAVALPVVVARGQPLLFRRWAPGDPLEEAAFGLRIPRAEAPELTPEIVVTPFVAADAGGYRLGYGGGYYDRTLHALRASGAIIAIGAGFDSQIVESVPRDANDARLDWIITEKRTIQIGSAKLSRGD